MVFLARHEESIKARLWFAFQYTFPINLIQSFTSLESLWTSSSSLYQKLSEVFWFSKPWKLVLFLFSFSSPFAKKNSPTTSSLNSFCVSLLPFPKERRTNRLNSFCVSLLPCQGIQNDTVCEFFWFFPFPKTRVFKGLTAWEFFCIPIHKISKV